MKLEVLISCMNQIDSRIIEKTNINSDTLIINQCNENRYNEFNFKNNKIRFISCNERGLSRSRNMALTHSKGDVCLICDDDEILYDNYNTDIIQSFINLPDADIIAFKIDLLNKKYPTKTKKINYLSALKISSIQIAFKRKSITEKKIFFDESLGSGVSKAGGEENMFLYDCLKAGLKIYFIPISIGKMIFNESQWFNGYTKEYFYDRGIFTKKLMGKFMASLYAIYFLIFKHSLYHKDISTNRALISIFKGIYE